MIFIYTQATDKQPLLDSGILCCLIHILSALLTPDKAKRGQLETLEESTKSKKAMDDKDALRVRRLEVNSPVNIGILLLTYVITVSPPFFFLFL